MRKNSTHACGSFNNDCTLINGWIEAKDNVCQDDGQCYAASCAPGYHIYNQPNASGVNIPCEQDTNAICGTERIDCTTQNLMCSNGSCVSKCAANLKACGTDCVDIQTHMNHCGDCGIICQIADYPHATKLNCIDGQCTPTNCVPGFHVSGSVCEADTDSNCGGKSCAIANGTGKCTSGKCEFTCNNGFHKYNDSCEADSINNCGAHGNNCTVQNGKGKCTSGKCEFTCNNGFHKYNNTCEANSENNCGTHGSICRTNKNNMTPMCLPNGDCVEACLGGYENCDGNLANGCEFHSQVYFIYNCNICKPGYTNIGTLYPEGVPRCVMLDVNNLGYYGSIEQVIIAACQLCNPGGICHLTLYPDHYQSMCEYM